MRTGLVVIGMAVAVVGAGLTLSVFFEPAAAPNTQIHPVSVPNILPGHPTTLTVWLQNTSAGSLAFNWVASSNVNVSLYKAVSCAFVGTGASIKYCLGPLIALWPSSSTGHYNASGAIVSPFLLNLNNSGARGANVSAVFQEQWAGTSSGVPTWILLSALSGGIICLVIGGLAVFLGFFLRSGVYSSPPPLRPPLDRVPDDEFEDDELLDDPEFDEPPL